MATMEEFLCQVGQEKFAEAIALNDVTSKGDPEDQPYRSKYEARELFNEIKQELEGLEQIEETTIRRISLLGVVNLRLGNNYIESDELSSGEEHLNKCVQALERYRLDPLCCNTLQLALNQWGYLWTGRGENQRAQNLLEQAETLYHDYKRDVGSCPVMSDELFQMLDEDESQHVKSRNDHFENTYTNTVYYLAQVYGRLEQNHKSAQYCHKTLRRQLDTKQYEPIEWSLNAATLSQYYITQADFPHARHCLASACFILRELGDQPSEMTVVPDPEESQEELTAREKLPKAWADTYRCWTKYGIALLQYSKAKLLEDTEEDANTEGSGSPANNDLEHNEEKDEKFVMFDLELTSIESEISNSRARDFPEARAIFLPVQKWLNLAKEFYVLDGHCTDHVEIIQDHSELFKLLAFFEPDYDRQSKMHKRRVDLLHSILDDLSSQFYLMICRQMIYELAETYSTMMDIKMTILESSGAPPTPHAALKINQLTTSSIKQYQTYIDSLKDGNSKLPSKFSDDDERPAVVAYFCMGRLYSKMVDFDPAIKVANLKKSVECYQFVVDYCKINPDSEAKVKDENEICKEMVVLLPTKMERIRARSDI